MSIAVGLRFKEPFFPFLLLLSGFAGISYELLYARMLGNIIGDQWLVSAAILLTFLLGIGIGTRYAHRFWPHLWLIELGIGLFAIGFSLSSEFIEAWLYSSQASFGPGIGITLAQSFLLLLPPAFLIGCGLPLFAGYLGRLKSGLAFASAYCVHCLGAALTVLLVEFWLLRLLGLQTTVFFIAGINILTALLLRFGYNDIRQQIPKIGHYIKLPRHQLLALALLSIASAIFQLWLVKIAELMLGPFRETFALVLALVLFGITLGTWLVKKFRFNFVQVVAVNLFGLLWLMTGFSLLSEVYAALYTDAVQSGVLVLLKFGLLAALAGLPAISFGATIPALITAQDNVACESGQLLFISSIANAAGFLLMLFVLHENFSYGALVIVIVAISSLGLISYFRNHKHAIVTMVAVLGISVLCQLNLWNEQLLYLGYDKLHSAAELEKSKLNAASVDPFKGPKDVFALNTLNDGRTYLYINGYRSMDLNRPHEHMVGAMSSMFAPRNDNALVLGVGSGATASTVGLLFDQVDTVEINAVLLDKLDLMSDFNFGISQADNVNIIHDDGIRYTKTSEKKYSLILNTVTTPLYFSSSKLYTLDFFETVIKRLTPDGVYVTWVDNRIGDRGMDIILKTLSQVFEQCGLSYINREYFLLLCSGQPLAMHQISNVTSEPRLQQYFNKKFSLLSNMLPYTLLKTNVLNLLGDAEVPVNTLDYSALEFEMAQLKQEQFNGFIGHLYADMDIDDVGSVIAVTQPSDPMLLAIFSAQMFGENPIATQWRQLLQQTVSDFERRYEGSLMNYYAYLAAEVDTVMSHYFYAFKLFQRQQFEAALRESKLVAALDPEYRNVNYILAASLESQGDLDQATIYYEKELNLQPENVLALKGMGSVYAKKGQPEQSLVFIDRALAIEESAEFHYIRANALAQLGKKVAAEKALHRSLELEPDNARVLSALEGLRN